MNQELGGDVLRLEGRRFLRLAVAAVGRLVALRAASTPCFSRRTAFQGKTVRPDVFPVVQWVSVADGTRNPGDIEDRAARFILEQNVLQINADFRVFGDMIGYWGREI
jgi:hypothetical protein